MPKNTALNRYRKRLGEIKSQLEAEEQQFVTQEVVLEVERVVHEVNLSFGGVLPELRVEEFHGFNSPTTGEAYYYRIPLIQRISQYLGILETPLRPRVKSTAPRQGFSKGQSMARHVWPLMHPEIRRVAKEQFDDGHYAPAVLAAMIEVNSRVKKIVKVKTGKEWDGADLMRRAFSPNNPVIVLGDLSTESGHDMQQGYMEIFAGAMMGIRNPKAHENISITPERALHFLFLASLLMHRLDEAVGASLEELKKTYDQHHHESGKKFPPEMQCQCDKCKSYRALATV
ncbi:MAG: TIGR02391 family protein [Terriglobia bacterium]